MFYRMRPHELILMVLCGYLVGGIGAIAGVAVGLGWHLTAIALAVVELILFASIADMTSRRRRLLEHQGKVSGDLRISSSWGNGTPHGITVRAAYPRSSGAIPRSRRTLVRAECH